MCVSDLGRICCEWHGSGCWFAYTSIEQRYVLRCCDRCPDLIAARANVAQEKLDVEAYAKRYVGSSRLDHWAYLAAPDAGEDANWASAPPVTQHSTHPSCLLDVAPSEGRHEQ
jgi:hypothetical protein